MLKFTFASNARHILVSLCLMGFLILCPNGERHVEATIMTDDIMTVAEGDSWNNMYPESPLDLRKPQGSEKRFFGETFSADNFQNGLFQSQGNPLLRLKSPGKLPGIEFGIELHSLQAFQSVVPSESLPQGLDLKPEQPLLLPPSLNIPDYNGGFIRFTW